MIITPKILKLARILCSRSIEFKSVPAVGRTHGQHASIISFGLKFAVWTLETVKHVERIYQAQTRFLLCKTLGVVGTGSLMGEKALSVQELVSKKLKLHPVEAATQIIPRERYAETQFLLSLIGSTLEKIAIEVRNLQRPELGEVSEFFKKGQMGSSAVPVKRNPIKSERVSSLAKLLRSLVSVSMENIPLWHERDLSNSANERFTIPMGVILLDEMLNSMTAVVQNLKVDVEKITSNLEITSGQIYAEFVLEALVKKGIPRFDAYRDIQRIAFSALENKTHFFDSLRSDPKVAKNLSTDELLAIFNAKNHLSASEKIIENVSALVSEAEKRYKNYPLP